MRTSTAVHPRMDGSAPRPASSLTPRQWQAAALVAEGWSYSEAAVRMVPPVGQQHVKNLIRDARARLDVGTNVELYRRLGWLSVQRPAVEWSVTDGWTVAA